MISARNASSLARCSPTSRGNNHEPPKSMARPRLAKISVKRARSDATIRSHPSARLHPAPAATPFTAAIVGNGSSCSRSAARPTMRIEATDAPAPVGASPPAAEVRSAPEQNASPAPVITSTRSSATGREVVEDLDQAAPHLAGDRVLALGPVDRERHDALDRSTIKPSVRSMLSSPHRVPDGPSDAAIP